MDSGKLLKRIFEKIKRFLISPKKAFDKEKHTKLGDALVYGAFGLLVTAIFTTILVTYLMPYILPVEAQAITGVISILTFFIVLIFGFISVFLLALWMHLWAYLLGARQGLSQTIKTAFYAQTPTYYLGWIPLVSYIAGIWSLVLFGMGLMKLQKMPIGKAVIAIILAIVIPAIIFIAFILPVILGLSATGLGAEIPDTGFIPSVLP